MRSRKPVYDGRAVYKLRGSETPLAAGQVPLPSGEAPRARLLTAAGKGPEGNGIHRRWLNTHLVRGSLRCGRGAPLSSAREDDQSEDGWGPAPCHDRFACSEPGIVNIAKFSIASFTSTSILHTTSVIEQFARVVDQNDLPQGALGCPDRE
jgi:hypothetical protein